MNSFRVIATIGMLLVASSIMSSTQAHNNQADSLIVEDGYLWFPKVYKTNTAVITNSYGDVAVDECSIWSSNHVKDGFFELKKSEEDEEITLTLDKKLVEDYLVSVAKRSQIKSGLEQISALVAQQNDPSIDIIIKKFISVKIAKNTTSCFLENSEETCPVKITDQCNVKLFHLPQHFFTNGQAFILTESIYPKTITIGSGEASVEVETIINIEGLSKEQAEGIQPLVSKIQYLTDYERKGTFTSPGPPNIKTRAIKIKRKPTTKKKVKFHWRGR